MKCKRAILIAVALVGATSLLASSQAEAAANPSRSNDSGEEYDMVVVAHPDDEMSQKAREQDSNNFQVFTLATQGGASVICTDYGGKHSEECKSKRVDSFIGFHNEDFSDVSFKRSTNEFDLYVGSESMLVVFDYRDGGLAEKDVRSAVRTTQNLDELSNKNLDLLVDGNYASDEEDYYAYEHPDHLAVSNVVRNWRGVKANRLSVTSPKYADKENVVNNYNYYMDCEEGIFNEHYGWLRPPCWPTDGTGGFTEHQYYWYQSIR